MSFNAAALRLMADKGLSAFDIAEIAAVNELKRDPTAAARMAKMRAKNKAETDVTPVTVTANVTRNQPPNERDNLTPKVIPTKPSGLEPKPKKHRLPIDWEPQPFKPGSMASLTVIRWEPGKKERELSKFRDHHTAAGSRFECWQSAWSKWVNNSEDFQRGRNGGQQQHPGLGKTSAAIAGLGDWNDDRPM